MLRPIALAGKHANMKVAGATIGHAHQAQGVARPGDLATRPGYLATRPGYRLHPLKDGMAGLWSVVLTDAHSKDDCPQPLRRVRCVDEQNGK